ncbi:MAG: hypothetical protein KAT04_03020 [Methylococcales bacterium]|nr:hypothetical protein [Methylococcales bacterium]
MNLFFKKVIVASILSALLCPASLFAGNKGGKRTVIAGVGFATPESVEYYAAGDVYLVSNINGDPLKADNNGFISKLSPEGKLLDLKWIDGANKRVTLHAPKGVAIKANKLYVTDLNQVQIFQLPSGKQTQSVTIKGSSFLNGITPGEGDFVYVTDSGLKAGKEGYDPSGTDAIYKVWANGKYKLVFKDNTMGRPNGILAVDKKLIVVSFGSGEVFSINASGKKTAMPKPAKGGLDGLLMLDDGRFLISSWGESAIYILNTDNSYSILADKLDAPADLGFDTKRNRVLVPLFKQNKLVFLSL